MIELFSRDAFAGLGMETILDIEKIPYRRTDKLSARAKGPVIVAASDLTADEASTLTGRPCLVLTGGAAFSSKVFGVRSPCAQVGSCTVPVTSALWPTRIVEQAETLGVSSLRIPRTLVCKPLASIEGNVVATFTESMKRDLAYASPARADLPAFAERGSCIWALINPGTAFSNLMTEAYLPPRHGRPSTRLGPSPLAAAAFALYYKLPASFRSSVQRRAYKQLVGRLSGYGDLAASYPIDTTGWLLIELVKSLIRRLTGADSVCLAKWPAHYESAATLTHDIEPTRYAYTRGLNRLLDRIGVTTSKSTLGLVAEPAINHLDSATVARTKKHGVLLHGVTHRGDATVASPRRLASYYESARERLELRLGRRILGFRSPRLDRSADLATALDIAGFGFDSSWPDVDRENTQHFGAGVRINFPYRPPIVDEDGNVRASRCLELPLTAPDCIQPLYGGASHEQLRSDVRRKADFIRSVGGLYVALVHGGVFGDADAEVREAHLDTVMEEVNGEGVWSAPIDEIAAWWRRRETVSLDVEAGTLFVTNNGTEAVNGLSFLVESASGVQRQPLPSLDAGERTAIPMSGVAKPAA